MYGSSGDFRNSRGTAAPGSPAYCLDCEATLRFNLTSAVVYSLDLGHVNQPVCAFVYSLIRQDSLKYQPSGVVVDENNEQIMAGVFQTTQKIPATQIQKGQRKPSWINTNRTHTDTHVDTYYILST